MAPRRRRTDLHLPDRVYFKNGSHRYLSRTKIGGKRWHTLGKEWDAGAKKIWVKLSSLDTPEPKGIMNEIFSRFEAEELPRKAEETQRSYKRAIAPLRAVFGHMTPSSIRPQDAYQYLDHRRGTPTAANQEISLLKTVFSLAIRWGYLEANPCRDVKKLKLEKRRRYITDEEYLAVWSAANPTVQAIMDFALISGQRISDILKIRLSDLRDDGIFVEQGKTGERLILEWSPDLREVVERARNLTREIGGLFLFHGRGGRPYTRDGFSAMFRRSVIKSGVEDFHFHDLRAKALTDLKGQGGDAQALAGHRSASMTEHYIKRRQTQKVTPLRRREG